MASSCSFCFKFIKLLGSVGLYFSSNLEKICQLFCHIFFRSSLLSCHPQNQISYMFFCLILIITKVVIFFALFCYISKFNNLFFHSMSFGTTLTYLFCIAGNSIQTFKKISSISHIIVFRVFFLPS